jgi:hypothetical protein
MQEDGGQEQPVQKMSREICKRTEAKSSQFRICKGKFAGGRRPNQQIPEYVKDFRTRLVYLTSNSRCGKVRTRLIYFT